MFVYVDKQHQKSVICLDSPLVDKVWSAFNAFNDITLAFNWAKERRVERVRVLKNGKQSLRAAETGQNVMPGECSPPSFQPHEKENGPK